MPIASLSTLQRVLVVGSFLRKDHPLFAQRIRQAARRGAKVHSLHALHDDWAMPMAQGLRAAPGTWLEALAGIAAAVAAQAGAAAPYPVTPGEEAKAIAASLASGERKAILLGNAAMQHPRSGALLALAQWIGEHTGAIVGCLGEAANSVGAQLVGMMPGEGGLDAQAMLSGGRIKAMLLLNLEPMLDAADPVAVPAALGAADTVIALTAFRSAVDAVADVMLPIAPFTETAGAFVNAEGRVQSFHGVVKPAGETRPAWKVLRVLGNLLGLPGFNFESAEEVRAEALGDVSTISDRLDNRATLPAALPQAQTAGLQRISDVPIYATDPIVRRAPALQATADARAPCVGLPSGVWEALKVADGALVRVTQGPGHAFLPARLDASLPPDVVRIPAGHTATAVLGAMFGDVSVSGN